MGPESGPILIVSLVPSCRENGECQGCRANMEQRYAAPPTPQQLPSRSPGWALTPRCLAVCAFPYLLAFTTDSMEIRLVVNGNLVHTAVVPQLQLVASRVSRAGVYFCLRGFGCPQHHEVSGGRGHIWGETDDDSTICVLR